MEEFTAIRREVKAEAKKKIKSRWKACIGVGFLQSLPFFFLEIIFIGILLVKAYSLFVYYGFENLVNEGVATQFAVEMVKSSCVGIFLFLLVIELLSWPLSYGVMGFYLGIHRGERPSVFTIFKPFTKLSLLWRSVKMGICLKFRFFCGASFLLRF